MHIEVRLAKKNDIKIIHDILTEIWECEIDERMERYNQALDSKFTSYLVAITEGKVVGFLNIWHLPDVVDGGVIGIILDCYVSTDFRTQGVGKMLMDSALELGKKYDVNKFFGWMNPENKPAVSLLKKYGFTTESLMLEKK